MVVNEYIIKVASRCNLNCSYCYMYNMGDTTYKDQPKFISLDVIAAFASKAKSHCKLNNVPIVHIAFHGGEPLLIEKEFYEQAVNIIRSTLDDIKVDFVLQTNGTLLDDEWCELFGRLGIQVGVSIDGTEKYHNQYRVYHSGSGSFNDVLNGINIRDRHSVGGLISVINIDIPPRELYEFFIGIGAKSVNILLPDNHYDNLPKGKLNPYDPNDSLYGDWMVELFDLWSKHHSEERPRIPYFENIIALILGFDRGDELIGKRKCRALTIESDGAIEVVDPLRICGNGFTRNKLNVMTHEISEIEKLPLFQEYYNSHDILCQKCADCSINKVCGGGYLGHRYSKVNRFQNPSIYCYDIIKLTLHIQNTIVQKLPHETVEKLGIHKADLHDIIGTK